jgi:dihydrofolate synthase/folylpolyglutamate synthase
MADGAHNADAAVKLADSIRNCLKGYEIILVMAVFADKEYDKVASYLAPLAKAVFTTQTPDNPRALDATELAGCVRKYCDDTRAGGSIEEACKLSLGEAESAKGKSAVVACGSLSYLKLFRDGITEQTGIKNDNGKNR